MIYKKIKTVITPIAKLALNVYYLKTRTFTYKGITVYVAPSVFPPKFTISTKLLLSYLEQLNVKDTTFLELGCGSGIVALRAAKKGAQTIATDINLDAVSNLKKASLKNNITLKVIVSNLFKDIPKYNFDYIFINPPYYPKNPTNIKEKAWFCGKNFEYFEALFSQLKHISYKDCIMILSEDCNITEIKNKAKKNNLYLNIIKEYSVFKEKNYIFKIEK